MSVDRTPSKFDESVRMPYTATQADIIRAERISELEVGQLYLAECGVEFVVVMYLGEHPKPMFKPKSSRILCKEKFV